MYNNDTGTPPQVTCVHIKTTNIYARKDRKLCENNGYEYSIQYLEPHVVLLPLVRYSNEWLIWNTVTYTRLVHSVSRFHGQSL